jgi:DNA-directed RNA polymerase specialized sigma24 family protein
MSTLTKERPAPHQAAVGLDGLDPERIMAVARRAARHLVAKAPAGMDEADLAQEAAQAIWEEIKAGSIPTKGDAGRWAYLVARNRIYDLFRRESARHRMLAKAAGADGGEVSLASLEAMRDSGWDVRDEAYLNGPDQTGLLRQLRNPELSVAIEACRSLRGLPRRYLRCLLLPPTARSGVYVKPPVAVRAFRDGRYIPEPEARPRQVLQEVMSVGFARRLIEDSPWFPEIRDQVASAWRAAQIKVALGLSRTIRDPQEPPRRVPQVPQLDGQVAVALDRTSWTPRTRDGATDGEAAPTPPFTVRQWVRTIIWPGVTHPAA